MVQDGRYNEWTREGVGEVDQPCGPGDGEQSDDLAGTFSRVRRRKIFCRGKFFASGNLKVEKCVVEMLRRLSFLEIA